MPNFNVANAKSSPQIVIRDAKGDVVGVVTPRDFQVGFEGNPGALILKGALDISANIIKITSPNDTTVRISNDIIAYFVQNTSGTSVTAILPTPPANTGQTHIVKDYQGSASSGAPIVITTADGSMIDGQPNMTITVAYGAIMFVWMGNAWVSLALGASGAGAGASSSAKYVVWDTEVSLTNSRKLTVVSGELTLDTSTAGIIQLGLPDVGVPGTYGYPSSVTTDAQGRVTSVGPAVNPGDGNASFVVMTTTGSLPNERALAVGLGLTKTDGGPGGNVTLAADDAILATISGSTFTGAVKFNAGLSGSLTRLIDGTSYIAAGSNITVVSQSNGQITISSTASGSSDNFDRNPSYVVLAATASLNNERILTPGSGLKMTDGGAGAAVTLSINDGVVATISGSTFTGPVNFNAGLSGSLTRLTNGQSYLVAGSNIVITSQSNGQITISSTASGSGLSGADADFVIGQNKLYTTSSVVIGSGTQFADAFGYDVRFYFSGTKDPTLVGTPAGAVAVFGGDVVFSSSQFYHTSSIWTRVLKNSSENVSRYQFLSRSTTMTSSLFEVTDETSGSLFSISNFTNGIPILDVFSDHKIVMSGTVYIGSGTSTNIIVPYVFFSGTQNVTGSNEKVVVFGGDVRVSGTINIGASGSRIFASGSDLWFFDNNNLTGWTLTQLAQSGTTSASSTGSIWIDGGNKARTTSSIAIGSGSFFASDIGSDIFFYVSGTVGVAGVSGRRSVFGGETIFSGGLSGSLTRLPDGRSYIVAGQNVTISSSSNGQVIISSTATGGASSAGSNRIDPDTLDIIVWRLNEVSGNTLFNSGSSGSLGDLTGSSQLIYGMAGVYDQAVDFRGYNAPVFATGSNSIKPKDSDITVSSWIYPHQFMSGVVVIKNLTTGSYDASSPIILGVTGAYGNPFVQLRTTSAASNLTVLDISRSLAAITWNHFGFSLSGSGTSMIGRFYLNGDFVRSMVLSGVLDFGSGTGWWSVGGLPTAGAEAGDYKLNEIRIANTVRNDQWWRDVYVRGLRGSGGSSGGAPTNATGTWRDPGNTFVTTGSVSIDAQNRTAAQLGTDVFFYVSGTINSGSTGTGKVSVFGGDVRVSGTLAVGTGSIYIDSNEIRWDNNTKLFKSGSDLRLADASNPVGYTLSQLAQSGSTGGGSYSAGFQQANYSISTSSNEWTVPTSTPFVGMPNLTASITTTGGPILVLVNANYEASNNQVGTAFFSLTRNGTNLGHSTQGLQAAGPMAASYNMAVQIAHLDAPPAGTYTYSLTGRSTQGAGKLGASGLGPTTINLIELKNSNYVSGTITSGYAIPNGSFNAVTGLSCSIIPARGPVLLIASLNYQGNSNGSWSFMSFFRGETNLCSPSNGSPNGLSISVASATGERMGNLICFLDTSPTYGSTNTYTVQAGNGGGTGTVNENGTISQIIAVELSDTNWKFAPSSNQPSLGTNTDIIGATNAATTLSTRGRPVLLLANVQNNTTIGAGRAAYTFLRDNVNVTTASKGLQLVDGEGNNEYNKVASLVWLDVVAAGAYKYSAVGNIISGSSAPAQGGQSNFLMWELPPAEGGGIVAGGWTDYSNQLRTTASVAISGQELFYARDKASDVFFYVSGTIAASNNQSVSLFGGDVKVSGSVQFLGGVIYNTTIVTGSYFINRDDYLIGVNQPNFSSSILYTPVGALTGRAYKIVDVAGNASSGSIVISGSAGELVAGSATYSISVNRASVEITKLAGNWSII